METMDDLEGAEYSCQRDLTGEVLTRCSVEIQGTFNDDVHSSSPQHSRDKPPPHIKCEDGLMCTRVDESVRNDEFASYGFRCPPFCDPSPSLAQYASVPCPDHMLPRPSPFHFLNPLPGLGKNEPSTWTPKGPVPYGMSSAEVSDAVASIITEEPPLQAYSIQESDGDEYRQSNYLEANQLLTVLMSPQDQPRQKPPTSNVCQVVCSVNRGGQMVVLNHCSPNQMLHPVALGYGGPGSKPSWFPADPTLSPHHSLMQGRGEGLPVCQVQSGLSTPYVSSLSCPAILPPSSIHSPASGYTYNLTPAPPISQLDQAPCTVHPDTVDRRLEGQMSESSRTSWEKLKKPCNCTKSQCLKLYCDCFANGEVCSDCNCINCCNNMDHESERCRAIKICLDRNPEAFHPKINIRKRGYLKGRHTKGCNCKRSGCLKNYCECYEAKIMCSSTCKCVGCRNYEGSPVREPAGWDNATYSLYSTFHPHSCKCPLSCITPDVVEATCGCLLAQAEEAENDSHARPQAERMILEEFGQCLTQIVHSIFKSARVQW